jgi:hypothetical protein
VTARLENGGLRVLAGRCPNLVGEAGLYRYSDDPRDGHAESPVDEHNHALAALRYLISGLDRRKMARLQKTGADATEATEQSNETKPKRKEERWLSVYNEELWRGKGTWTIQ